MKRNGKRQSAKDVTLLMNNWLMIYLPRVRRRSEHTIKTYESSLSLYLDFLDDQKNVSPEVLDGKCFRREWLEEWITSAKVTRKTCDLRLSAIRSLLKYMSSKNTIFTPYYLEAMDIQMLNHGHGTKVEGISKKAMSDLLSTMNREDVTSLRDRALFTMMYDTGGRVSEVVNIKICDLRLESPNPYVIVIGKGSKARTLLLSTATVSLLKKLIKTEYGNNPCSESYLFYSRVKGRRSPLSTDAVNSRLKVYSRKAHLLNPEVPENMHTHQIRHSACTHWYQDNINLAEISTYLGHESIETTRVYLGISKEELEQALSKRESIDVPTTSKYKNIKGGLRSLLRKKTL